MKLIVAIPKVISDRNAALLMPAKYNNITVKIRNPSEKEVLNLMVLSENPLFLGFLSSMINQNPKSMLDAVKMPLMCSGLTETIGNHTMTETTTKAKKRQKPMI